MNSKNTKMIKVTSRGLVNTSRGQVLSPIDTYRETLDMIWSLITIDHATVEEEVAPGKYVRLTAQNFDQDNSNFFDIPKTPKAPVETLPKEELAKEEKVEIPQTIQQQNNNRNYQPNGKHNNKNKHNNNNNSNNNTRQEQSVAGTTEEKTPETENKDEKAVSDAKVGNTAETSAVESSENTSVEVTPEEV